MLFSYFFILLFWKKVFFSSKKLCFNQLYDTLILSQGTIPRCSAFHTFHLQQNGCGRGLLTRCNADSHEISHFFWFPMVHLHLTQAKDANVRTSFLLNILYIALAVLCGSFRERRSGFWGFKTALDDEMSQKIENFWKFGKKWKFWHLLSSWKVSNSL